MAQCAVRDDEVIQQSELVHAQAEEVIGLLTANPEASLKVLSDESGMSKTTSWCY